MMEHAGHGDLLEYIKLRGAIPEDKSRVMYKQLMDAVDYLHVRFIVHRLDSENQLVTFVCASLEIMQMLTLET